MVKERWKIRCGEDSCLYRGGVSQGEREKSDENDSESFRWKIEKSAIVLQVLFSS